MCEFPPVSCEGEWFDFCESRLVQLLICVLQQTEKLNDLMEALAKLGVSGATVLESQGMAKVLSHNVPVFAGFRHILAGDRPFNYTIFSVIEEAVAERTLEAIRQHFLPGTARHSQGIAFTVPVSNFLKFGTD